MADTFKYKIHGEVTRWGDCIQIGERTVILPETQCISNTLGRFTYNSICGINVVGHDMVTIYIETNYAKIHGVSYGIPIDTKHSCRHFTENYICGPSIIHRMYINDEQVI